ncbi:class I SAM-dependent methyltransferase [Hydrogenophaga sp.]|uniref:class I SAM-dependent methyltransferase n=1 Tax=Hydrogenophaga sp. TaxID=1904254 RepID=UPI002728D266|nr:class I SAM-dependent methyltransferase [Hydrogenophaga sp.]MDO8904183.1 class I SAM-dependent methyltransferase [Hydrogenophaga sp.]
MQCPVCESKQCQAFQTVGDRTYLRCLDCLATFLHPEQRPGPDTELAEYRLHQNAEDDAHYRQFLSKLSDPLLQRLPPSSRGLDYGCGPAPALAALLRESGHEVALYDPFFHPGRSVLTCTYDFVTCTEVIEHFHQPANEFRRFDTLLAPGGWLALMTNFQTDDARFAGWHYRRDPTHVVFYREATLHWLARRHGWTCEIPGPNVALMHKPPGRS